MFSVTVTDFFFSDYAPDARLDTYSDADLDDEGEYDEMSAAARRAAEMEMARRDRADRQRGRGSRAAKRSRAPAFLQDDDDDEDDDDPNGGLLVGMKKRTRKQYDERRDIDDAEGADDVGIFATIPTYASSHTFRRMCHLSISEISRLTQFQRGLRRTASRGPLKNTS